MEKGSPAVQREVWEGAMDDKDSYEGQHKIESDIVKAMICIQGEYDSVIIEIPISQVCLSISIEVNILNISYVVFDASIQ